jgi:hypothetical protein
MNELDLSDIETLRKELGCREGLLIDFDYASFLDLNVLNTETGRVVNNAASTANETLGESQCESSIYGQSQGGSQGGSQDSGQDSSQSEGKEGFEVVDNDSGTVIQPTIRKFSGARTVRYYNSVHPSDTQGCFRRAPLLSLLLSC